MTAVRRRCPTDTLLLAKGGLPILDARGAESFNGPQGRGTEPLGHGLDAQKPVGPFLDAQAGRLRGDEEEVLHILGHEPQVFVELRASVQTGQVQVSAREGDRGSALELLQLIGGQLLDLVQEVLGSSED